MSPVYNAIGERRRIIGSEVDGLIILSGGRKIFYEYLRQMLLSYIWNSLRRLERISRGPSAAPSNWLPMKTKIGVSTSGGFGNVVWFALLSRKHYQQAEMRCLLKFLTRGQYLDNSCYSQEILIGYQNEATRDTMSGPSMSERFRGLGSIIGTRDSREVSSWGRYSWLQLPDWGSSEISLLYVSIYELPKLPTLRGTAGQ